MQHRKAGLHAAPSASDNPPPGMNMDGTRAAGGHQAAGGGGAFHPSPATSTGAGTTASGETDAGKAQARLTTLLRLEGELRKLPDRRAVELFAVNEFRQLLPFSQAAFISLDRRGKAKITAFSGLAQVDRQAPLVRALEGVATRLARRAEGATRPDHSAASQAAKDAASADNLRGDLLQLAGGNPDTALHDWAFRHVLWHLLRDHDGRPFAALLFMRAEPWREADEVIGERLAGAVAQAIRALSPRSVFAHVRLPRRYWLGALVLLALALFIPVPMTAVAPVEVVADDPLPITAPLDGVIASVAVAPNTKVKPGQELFRFDATRLQAEAEIAARREQVARARLATLRKAAFASPQARELLAEAKTELELARAEREYAERLLSRIRVTAPRAGIVIFADRARLIGKPVKTGEKIMELADPRRVAFRIHLPVSDAIAIREGGRVKVFLDADPLDAIEARVRWASFHAEEIPGGLLAFRIIADPVAQTPQEKRVLKRQLRIGFRGSAQVFGEKVPLGFYLLRRPIAALRQFLGW